MYFGVLKWTCFFGKRIFYSSFFLKRTFCSSFTFRKRTFCSSFFFKVDFLLVFFRPMEIYTYFGFLKWTFCSSIFPNWTFCSFFLPYGNLHVFRGLKQNRSTEGCSKLKRSEDMTSSGKNGLNIRTNASPKWDRIRFPEE